MYKRESTLAILRYFKPRSMGPISCLGTLSKIIYLSSTLFETRKRREKDKPRVFGHFPKKKGGIIVTKKKERN